MSGGSFDYAYFHFSKFADDLESCVINSKEYHLSEEWINKMKKSLELFRFCSELSHEIEWVYSGDTGEESFKERMEAIIKRNPEYYLLYRLIGGKIEQKD